MNRLKQVLDAIDALNASDPRQEGGQPEALLYGQRMSAELDRMFPDASDILKIAARGQHVERWALARSDYPQGRAGYLEWRRDLGAHHARRVGELMAKAGYRDEDIEQTGRMLRKEGIKRDPGTQALEDVICVVFLRWYFSSFAAKYDPEKVENIVRKTARKMSAEVRQRVLRAFDLPDPLAAAFRG